MDQADKYAEVAMSADRYNPSGRSTFLLCDQRGWGGGNKQALLSIFT